MVCASVDGLPERDRYPLWEKANELGSVVHIHPELSARRKR
jgi:hypothetical protein